MVRSFQPVGGGFSDCQNVRRNKGAYPLDATTLSLQS